jgi:hypothetical protein
MSTETTNADHDLKRRSRAYRAPAIERLESRALLATASPSFQPPDLSGLIRQADRGANTAPAAIDRMVQALESQLTTGPLADLNAGTVDGSGFVQEVSSLVTSYKANADQQLSPQFPNVDNLIKLQGTRILADVTALNQQSTAGLLTTAQLRTSAATAISDLTGGALKPLGTPFTAYATRTQTFESGLNTLAQGLATGAATPLTIAQVNTTVNAEAEAYRADLAGSLYVHPNVEQIVNTAVTTLENSVSSAAQSGGTTAQAQVQAAITAFDAAMLDTTGLFGPQGLLARRSRGD